MKDSLLGEKYFIFKMREYLNNSNHCLENKRWESIRALFLDCIDVQDEINKSNGENDRQQKSLNYLYQAIIFYCENNPLCKHLKIKRDIEQLVKNLKNYLKDSNIINSVALYNLIKSMLSRLNNINIISLHVDILKESIKNENKLSFKDIDILLDSFVSELLYQGYSTKYLENWYKENIQKSSIINALDTNNIEQILDKFIELSSDKKEYSIILNTWIPNEIKINFFSNNNNNAIKIKKYLYEGIEKIPDDIETTFSKSENMVNLMVKIEACDEYSAIDIARKVLENYFELFKEINGYQKDSVCNNREFIVKENTSNWRKVIREVGDLVELKAYNTSDNREKDDIKDFNNLRISLAKKNIDYFDIDVLERILDIVKGISKVSSENKLLNTWSALEYILTFYDRKSIIEKARNIIPKVISIYYIKEKMNILWERLKKYSNNKNNSEVIKFLNDCKKDEQLYKYDKNKFVEYISDIEKTSKLADSFNNVIIKREIMELNSLFDLKKIETTKNLIILNHDKVEMDLNRIYRIRNKIVHSGNNLPENIDIVTIRLIKYINGLIRTLIHYIGKNNELTISEVLYSIIDTYEWYISMLKDNSKDINKFEVASPLYLYL